jgi:hypothetical protein
MKKILAGHFSPRPLLLPIAIMLTATLVSPVFAAINCASPANPVQAENCLAGDYGWLFTRFDDDENSHDLEGYANKDSVEAGQPISFHISGNPSRFPQYTFAIYRLGWYDGVGARKMVIEPITQAMSRTLLTVRRTIPVPDPSTGLVQANWPASTSLTIPANWASGIYVAAIVGKSAANTWTDNKGQYIPFVVRKKATHSKYLFQASTTTWQAYNAWGGKSLYGYNSDSRPVNGKTGNNIPARKVSFNRPYDTGAGVGSLFNWELNMLYFLERNGYDVTYQTNTDTHTGDGGLLNHKAVFSVGHDEYWSKAMRDNFETARDYGVSLGFFGGNAAYWQIRLENNKRTVVGYKDNASTEDPCRLNTRTCPKDQTTARWRDPSYANRPENSLMGMMYSYYPVIKCDAAIPAYGCPANVNYSNDVVTTVGDPLVSSAKSHWMYTNTGIMPGFVLKGLLGYEADRIYDNGKTPAGLEVVAASPVLPTSIDEGKNDPASANYDPAAPKSQMTIYNKPCTLGVLCQNPSAMVFATGGMQWVWALDSFQQDHDEPTDYIAQIITRNVLARMINEPLPNP